MNTGAALALAAGGAAVVIGGAIVLSRRSSSLGRARGKSQAQGHAGVARRGRNGEVLRGFRSSRMTIQQRLKMLQELTAKSVQDPEMRKLALQVTQSCEARDDVCEARAIGNWVKRNIRYTGDVAPHRLWTGGPVESVDLYQAARRTVEFKGGDCDDAAVLNATLLILNGIPAKFRVTSPYKWGSDNYTHIYTMAGLPKGNPTKWMAVDTTLPDYTLGKEYPFAKNMDVVA